MKSLLKNFKKSRKKIVIISMTQKETLKNLKSKLLTLKSKTIKTNQNNNKNKKLKSSLRIQILIKVKKKVLILKNKLLLQYKTKNNSRKNN